MIVIYTGDITRKQVTTEYNIGALKLSVEPAFLSELHSEEIYQGLKEKVEKNERLDDEELMEFIILPLSYRKKNKRKKKSVRQSGLQSGLKTAVIYTGRHTGIYRQVD